MELRDFKVGDLVRVHPASNWFMRGVTFATVVKIGRKLLTVKGAGLIANTFKLHPHNVMEIV